MGTSLPIVESEPDFELPVDPSPPQVVTTTTPFSQPVPPPAPSNTVQLTPADLQAAITEAIRISVTKSVNEAIELRKAAQNRQQLESAIRFAVSEAVRRAVVKSVKQQATIFRAAEIWSKQSTQPSDWLSPELLRET